MDERLEVNTMKEKIKKTILEHSLTVKTLLSTKNLGLIESLAKRILTALGRGGKIIVFGNGGSAADSQHMAAELVGRFLRERPPIPAVALTTNSSSITALSNDYGYGVSFTRQLEALASGPDVVIGISTSGTAENVIAALGRAKEMGILTVALTGRGGGRLKDIADVSLIVKSQDTPRIQEAHILIIHILCSLIEDGMSLKRKKNG